MMKLAVVGIFTLFVLLNVSTVNARLVTDRKHTILARFKQQDSTATPTTQPFIPPTAAPVSCNTANFTFNVSLSTGFIDANFTQGDATQPTLTWVDIHVSKNCPNAAATCPLPFVQDPFDMPYALNLHASSDANAFSTPGASFISDGTNSRVFHWHIATDVMFLTPQDKICYSFTYTFGSDACNYGNCLL